MRKRSHNFIDLTGKKFNFLTVLGFVESADFISRWKCICSCGKTTIVIGAKLKNGTTKSCGCYSKKKASERMITHGFSKTKLPNVRNSMIQRCKNQNSESFNRYGGRGITVCDEWINDPSSFYDWAMANGYKDGLSIDRINNDGNYEPLNCRWITLEENIARNSKIPKSEHDNICNLYLTRKVSQAEIAKKYNVHPSRIMQILHENNIKTDKRNQYGVWK